MNERSTFSSYFDLYSYFPSLLLTICFIKIFIRENKIRKVRVEGPANMCTKTVRRNVLEHCISSAETPGRASTIRPVNPHALAKADDDVRLLLRIGRRLQSARVKPDVGGAARLYGCQVARGRGSDGRAAKRSITTAGASGRVNGI